MISSTCKVGARLLQFRHGYVGVRHHYAFSLFTRHIHQTLTSHASPQGTIDKEEVAKFSRLAHIWWDEGGEMVALHTMNRLRVPLIREVLVNQCQSVAEKDINVGEDNIQPLQNMKILDVGCGAGILSEPLARIGASVTGLDAAAENINMAKWHMSLDATLPHITYLYSSVENVCDEQRGLYDGVIASEIVEHVSDVPTFLQACCQMLKPGGLLFVTTLNRTIMSLVAAKFMAEYIFRIVPAGAHDWNKFVSPQELGTMLSENGMQNVTTRGMTMNPFTMRWCWINDTNINYTIYAKKPLQTDN